MLCVLYKNVLYKKCLSYSLYAYICTILTPLSSPYTLLFHVYAHLGAGKGYTWEESSKVIDIKVQIEGVEKREMEGKGLSKRDIEVEIL